MTEAPTLVLVAHGTARSAARTVVGALVADVRAALPDVEVRLAHVDVQSPALTTVMADVRAGGAGGSVGGSGRAVVVPLLLSAGFHVEVDIADAVDPRLDVVTPTLAGDPALVDIGLDRLAAAGGVDLDAVVVAAAGSSRASARRQVHDYAAAVGARLAVPATVGWVAGEAPDLDAVVAAARLVGVGASAGAVSGGRRVGVVSYLLAPGVFAQRAQELAVTAGAVAVGTALGPDRRLAEIVVRRFRAACR